MDTTTNPLSGATEEVLRGVALALEPYADRLTRPHPDVPLNPDKPSSPVSAPLGDPPNQDEADNILARVIHDYDAEGRPEEISISKGEFVLIKDFSHDIYEPVGLSDSRGGHDLQACQKLQCFEWCYGYVLDDHAPWEGYFPSNCIEEVDEHTMINVTDPDFVPDGFHENCRDENGAVKITDENRHLYQDVAYLSRIYKEEGWAQKEGTLYTKEMTGCPEGRLPTLESLMSLQLSGHKLYGRIIMTENNVFDADTQNKLANLTPENYEEFILDFSKKNEWTKRWEPMPENFTITTNVDRVVKDGSHMKIQKGEYKLKPITHKKSEEGLSEFCVCDEPTCCFMTMGLLGFCSGGLVDTDSKYQMMDYFTNRPMYQNKDEIYGNTEICHYCLHQAVSE